MRLAEFSLSGKRVWVAGHEGMVGAAIARRLRSEACSVVTAARRELDLRQQDAVDAWMAAQRPQAIFLAAARVGGIHANHVYPVDFLYDNLIIQANVIRAAWKFGVEKLLFLGSSCIYPVNAPQPMAEDTLLTGPLEATNEWYAIAKIAGIKLCQAFRRQYGCNFISVMPTNLYGVGDNFHPDNSHVPAALLRRFHEAKLAKAAEVVVWGTGRPRREFMHVDDLADACIFLMRRYSGEPHVNVGTGEELSIADFADAIRRCVGYHGNIRYDTSRPDGAPRKLLDCSRLRQLGWTPSITLEAGLRSYYAWFLENQDALRETQLQTQL